MRLSILGLLFMFFSIRANAGSPFLKKDQAIQITNVGNTTFYFSYFDSLQTFNSLTISKGQMITIHSSTPLLLKSSTLSQTPFLLLPLDVLTVNSDGKGDYIFKAKDNIQRSNELGLLKAIHKKYDYDKEINAGLVSLRKNVSPLKNQFKIDAILKDVYKNETAYMEVYMRDKPVSDKFKVICKNYLFYKMLAKQISFLNLKPELLSKFPSEYKDSLSKLNQNLSKDEYLYIDMYKMSCLNYLYYLKNKHKDDTYDNLLLSFSGKSKDFLLLSLLSGYDKSNQALFFKFYNRFLKDCKNNDYKDIINKSYSYAVLKQKTSKDNLLSTDNQSHTIQEILARNKGKYLYIDFWASWCSPCIDEMPGSIVASRNNKDIVFLYFSLDKDINSWMKAVKELKLNQENSYLMVGDFSSDLVKTLHIKSIPHYIIMNKNAEILNNNAPRPSDAKLQAEFDKLKQ